MIDGAVDLRFVDGALPELEIAGSPGLTEVVRGVALAENPVTYKLGGAQSFFEGGGIRIRFEVERGEVYKLQVLVPAWEGVGNALHRLALNGRNVFSFRPTNVISDPASEVLLVSYAWEAEGAVAEFLIDTRLAANTTRAQPFPAAVSMVSVERITGSDTGFPSASAVDSLELLDTEGEFVYGIDLGGGGGQTFGDLTLDGCANAGPDVAAPGVLVSGAPDHFRGVGLFPDVETPDASPPGGFFEAPVEVELDALGQPGELFYTTDGTDPRVAGRYANRVLLPEFAPADVLVPDAANGGLDLGESWSEFEDPANIDRWVRGETGVGFETSGSDFTDLGLIRTDVVEMQGASGTVYVRVPFELTAVEASNISRLVLRMRYDDGFVAFLNGERVAAANQPVSLTPTATAVRGRDDTDAVGQQVFDITSASRLLREGRNILAIQGLNVQVTSSDLLVLPEVVAVVAEVPPAPSDNAVLYQPGGPQTIASPTTIKARLRHSNGDWSALLEERYQIGAPSAAPGELEISELHYRPLGPAGDELSVAGSRTDFEFVEIRNVSGRALSLAGLRFGDGIEFDFSSGLFGSLAPGEYALVVANRAAFVTRYGGASAARVTGEFAGGTSLSNGGERVSLVGHDGTVLSAVTYDDSAPWPEEPDGDGPSLELISPGHRHRPARELEGERRRGGDTGCGPGQRRHRWRPAPRRVGDLELRRPRSRRDGRCGRRWSRRRGRVHLADGA